MSAHLTDPLSWSSPTLVVLCLLGLLGVVIALGRSATARYESDRYHANAGRTEAVAATVQATVSTSVAAAMPGDRALAPLSGSLRMAPVVALDRPAGPARISPRTAAWWLKEHDVVVAGPFADRIEAEWAALATDLEGSIHLAHGVLQPNGVPVSSEPLSDRAWLAALGLQLARLPEDWDAELSDDDPLATLVVEIAAALFEVGLSLHDSTEAGSAVGGVCLTPEPGFGGIVVTWRQPDRMSVAQVHGATADDLVHDVMNGALANVLRARGFVVDAFGGGTAHVVRAVY